MKTLGYTLLVIASFGFSTGCKSNGHSGGTDAGTGTGGDTGTGGTHDAGHDGGNPSATCGHGMCDVVRGTGCGASEGCQFLSPAAMQSMQSMCVMAGAGTDGMACANYMECANGFACIPNSDGMSGKCRHYCCLGSDTGCPTGTQCLISLTDAMTGMGSGVGVCRGGDTCDPIAQTGCGTGEGCYVTLTSGVNLCVPPSAMGAEGATCMATNDCSPGLECMGFAAGDIHCYKLCDSMATTSGCSASQMCQNLMVPGEPNLGACVAGMGGVDAGTAGGTDAGTAAVDAATATVDAAH